MLKNDRVTAFTVSELLREKQQGVKLLPLHSPCHTAPPFRHPPRLPKLLHQNNSSWILPNPKLSSKHFKLTSSTLNFSKSLMQITTSGHENLRTSFFLLSFMTIHLNNPLPGWKFPKIRRSESNFYPFCNAENLKNW